MVPNVTIVETAGEVVCNVISLAPFTVKWFLNGKRHGDVQHFKYSAAAKLSFLGLNEAQIDDGQVTCLVTNVAGTANQSIYVTVPGKLELPSL